ncbi:MAG: caspase family protein [Candidatus Symbiothrix sp.]|jgi:tetratricopeptide (TPR) repeat protein|nr:caspase family protein [Candidatus Symbiothrix sp.]
MIRNKGFILFSLLFSLGLHAQTMEETLRKGNQQYVLFESERDKGNMDAAYNYLSDSYSNLKKVVEQDIDNTQRNAAKNRLKSAYVWFEKATLHYAEMNNGSRALQFAIPYVEIPKLSIMRSEPITRSGNYPNIVRYAGVSAYKLNRFDAAILLFKEYLETGESQFEKDAFMYLNMIYQAQKNYQEQENILEKACVKYPLALDFFYNLVNVYIATKNNEKLLAVIERILEVDPNNEKILPMKARFLSMARQYDEALEIYQRLHTLYPNNFDLLTGLAKANYSKGKAIIDKGADVFDIIEYAKIKQEAEPYMEEAQRLFLIILEQQPDAIQYMQGLAGIYQYFKLTPEYETINKIIQDNGSYLQFADMLAEYKRTHLEDPKPESEGQTELAEAIPVPVNPAKLMIRINDFADNNQNKVIDAGESFAVTFTLENQGQGDAFNIRIRLSEQQGLEQYFDGAKEIDGGRIEAGQSKQFTMRYIADKALPTGDAIINIYAFEGNGFDADPAELQVSTIDMAIPRLTVADYQFIAAAGTSITLGADGKLMVAVRNEGSAMANNVKVNFSLPNNVFKTSATELIIDSIATGEVKIIPCDFVVNKRFDQDSIAILMVVTEPTKSSYINDTYKVKVGQYLTSANTLKIEGLDQENRKSARINDNFSLSFRSELLESVPDGLANSHRYALVIGNEDYSRAGANAEINVPYAVNDAIVFREYCLKTFGIPSNQVKLVCNATAGIMHEQLDWLINMASADPEAELFFFYSGHGNNDESTRDAFLIPVDVSGKNIRFGISIESLYAELSKYSIKGAYVFLDACFSGGFKGDAALVAAKAVRVVAKTGVPRGNTLCISSSSGDQTSNVYHEKKQGYFTYYLLKNLQEAGGDIDVKSLYEKTNAVVKQETARSGKIQEPQLLVSTSFSDWENVRLTNKVQ